MAEEKNGKWSLAFWIVTGLFLTTSLFMGSSIIANDCRRQEGDKELWQEIYSLRKEQSEITSKVLVQLSEISTTLKYVKTEIVK